MILIFGLFFSLIGPAIAIMTMAQSKTEACYREIVFWVLVVADSAGALSCILWLWSRAVIMEDGIMEGFVEGGREEQLATKRPKIWKMIRQKLNLEDPTQINSKNNFVDMIRT